MSIARPIPGWTPTTPPFVDESLVARLDDRTTIAVHFWASWNSVDPKFDEWLRQLTDRFASSMQFYSANIDLPENRVLCEQCQVLNVPTLSIRVSGQWQRPIVGCQPGADELAKEIESRRMGRMPLQRAGLAWFRLAAIGVLIAGALVFLSWAALHDRL